VYRPTHDDSAPVWQAYVEAGATKDERNARLAEAPEHLRQRVMKHVITAFVHRRRSYRKEM